MDMFSKGTDPMGLLIGSHELFVDWKVESKQQR